MPALRWQRVTFPLTRNFPRPRSLSNALRRRRPSASGSSTPPCAIPAPSARATRTSSRTAVSRAARRSKPVGSPARRQRAPVASGSSREDSSVRSRALGRTREPPARLVDVNEMNPFRLYPGGRSSPSASRARFDATRERLALSSRRENRENCVLCFISCVVYSYKLDSRQNIMPRQADAELTRAARSSGHRPSVSSPHRRAKTRTQRMCREGRCPSRAPSTPRAGDSRRRRLRRASAATLSPERAAAAARTATPLRSHGKFSAFGALRALGQARHEIPEVVQWRSQLEAAHEGQ